MNLTDIVAQMGGLSSMAQELGVSETQAASGTEALLPAILGGFKKQAQGRGMDGLDGLLGQLGGGSLIEDVLSPQPTRVDRGNDVLGQIFGTKDVSRTVAQNAASSTGIDPSVLKKMLPMVAMLVAGYMAKQANTSRGTGAAAQAPSPGGALGGLLGGLLERKPAAAAGAATGAGGLASLLDMDGDGNPLDDLLRMAGKAR